MGDSLYPSLPQTYPPSLPPTHTSAERTPFYPHYSVFGKIQMENKEINRCKGNTQTKRPSVPHPLSPALPASVLPFPPSPFPLPHFFTPS